MNTHTHREEVDDLHEVIRQSSERNLMSSLEIRRLTAHSVAKDANNRWAMFFLLLLVLREVIQPIRHMLMYPDSVAAKVFNFSPYTEVLPAWFGFCAAALVPLIVMFWLRPTDKFKRTCIGCAAVGLAAAAFGFGYMAMVVSRLDVKWAAEAWILSAVSCIAVMLVFAASVNTAQRHKLRDKLKVVK